MQAHSLPSTIEGTGEGVDSGGPTPEQSIEDNDPEAKAQRKEEDRKQARKAAGAAIDGTLRMFVLFSTLCIANLGVRIRGRR